jgi:UDP-GlcNAc:undecaprenyl-phosphate GlcNAc-1-phosphate transferase
MKTYLAVYLSSALLALVITPVVIWLARKLKAVNRPDVRTVHSKPIPRIGGVAIFVSAIALILSVLLLPNLVGQRFRIIKPQLVVLLSAATFIFLVGLIDDLKGLRASIKFLAELAAALIIYTIGVRIKSVAIADWLTIDFGWFSLPLTLLWIVGITNAVNLSDGLDGLAAGISAIACGVIAILAIQSGQVVMAVLMLALLGSLCGFLVFNFNPAKIFMGDCGSLFLGFTIATSSVMCASKSSALVGLALPMLALGIPIFDTLFSMLRRFLERRSMFSPDRSHFHHHLLALGLTHRHVVIIAYAVTCIFAGLGLFMMVTRSINTLVIFSCILLLLLLMFRVVGSVHLRGTIAGLQKKYEFSYRRRQEQMNFEQAQLYFRNARTFSDWWQAVCEAAKRMDFAWVSLKTKDKDGAERTEVWRLTDSEPTDKSEVVVMNVPVPKAQVRNHGLARVMEFEIAILVNGSLESAGHRATLFSRLIDEHSAINIL